MFGLLNVNKPSGMTSRDVVNRIQRLVRPDKIGHAGTLDPLATGVLVLCVGQATRLIEYVQRMPKRYTGTFLLGRRSDTEDVEGDVVELADAPQPARKQIEQTLPQFVGEIQQRPPAFSALKVRGKRAYRLAREGVSVELESRTVTIHALTLVNYEYPQLMLDVTCGSGTYIRSLGRDIAESLGTAAVMSALVRTAVGPFALQDACELDDVTGETINEHVLPATRAVGHLLSIVLDDEQIGHLAAGMSLKNESGEAAEEIAVVDHIGRLVAIAGSPHGRRLRPLRNFRRE